MIFKLYSALLQLAAALFAMYGIWAFAAAIIYGPEAIPIIDVVPVIKGFAMGIVVFIPLGILHAITGGRI